MLIVQKFHSIHEIDPEFIANIEFLLQEEVASFDTLVQRHDKAPASDVFTYFLFFGPTQNSPIGFAQLCLRQLPSRDLIPWYKRLKFWDKSHEHWKQLTWQVGDGSHGLCLIDSKYARTGKEKIQELIAEYELREDVKAQNIVCLKGLQDFKSTWGSPTMIKESFILDPLTRACKTYQDYLQSLESGVRKQIKESWKKLHMDPDIKLGDYPNTHETPKTLPIDKEQLDTWASWGAQVLTFEKDLEVLGCLLVLKGKNGNIFFEPFPFEPEGQSIVDDELYTQYAILKFFEMPEARKCHLMKFGSKLVFEDRADLQFFQEQGFQSKTITHSFYSRLESLSHPL